MDSRELLCRLGTDYTIDVFVLPPVASDARRLNRLPERVTIHPACDFVWREQRVPYDLTVHQLGNSAHHAYQWPYLFRYPGLLVLHDGHLHHSRAAALMQQRRPADYRAEFAACEPDTDADAAELAIAGFDSHLYYYWPFTRLVVEASRMTAVHTRALRDDLAAGSPEARVEYVRLAHGVAVSPEDAAERGARARSRFGVPRDAIVFGCFGGLTPEKRLPQVLDAFATIRHRLPPSVLVLGGESPGYYDLRADVARRDLDDHVLITGYIEDEAQLTDLIAASDITLNLRWPTGRELSGPWLRSLAAGRCSIVSALAHLAGMPFIDAATWTANRPAPIAVAIDVQDESALLPGAMRRLACDAPLRHRVGSDAREYWQAEHSYERMLDDYRRLIPLAASLPAPRPRLPGHLVSDTSALTTRLLAPLGVPLPWSSM